MLAKSALYFPFTEITPAEFKRAEAFFNQIIIQRLPLSQPRPEILAAAEQGAIRLDDQAFIRDETEIAQTLAGFDKWSEMFDDAQQIRMMKNTLTEKDPEQSESRLMSAIRSGPKSGPEPAAKLQAQLLLHFAERLDRERAEVDALMDAAAQKQSLLGGMMGVDKGEKDKDRFQLSITAEGRSPGKTPPEDLARRLTAWTLLFSPDSPPLFTDYPDVIALMDLNLTRLRGSNPILEQRPTEVLETVFEISQPLADMAKPDKTPWTDFIESLSSQTWKSKDLDGLRAEARKIHSSYSGSESGPQALVSCYLLPGDNFIGSFGAAAGMAFEIDDWQSFCGPIFLISDDGVLS